MEVSDSAAYYVAVVGDNRVSGEVMTLAGSLMWIGGVMALQGLDSDGQQSAALGVSLTGTILFLLGNRRLARAQNAMQSAIWWYNASLVNPLGDGPTGFGTRALPSPPVALASNHARAGTALGSVAGIVGGLAATSGLDSSRTREGLSITHAFTAVGALPLLPPDPLHTLVVQLSSPRSAVCS